MTETARFSIAMVFDLPMRAGLLASGTVLGVEFETPTDRRLGRSTLPMERTDRRLVIEKTSQQGSPTDGARDQKFTAVYVKIVRFFRTEARWPESGTYAA